MIILITNCSNSAQNILKYYFNNATYYAMNNIYHRIITYHVPKFK